MNNADRLEKQARLREFFARLAAASPADTHDAAFLLLSTTLNAVEDELSGIPYDPTEAGNDGRMYPPDEEFRAVSGERPGIRCYRQLRHHTLIADNGAIEIRERRRSQTGEKLETVVFAKAGRDGKEVADYERDP